MDRLQQLRKMIDCADIAYYNTGSPIYSNEQYDRLKDELIKLAPGDQRNARFGPPELCQSLSKVRHACFMGSLRKCDNQDDLTLWLNNCLSKLPNIDGVESNRLRRGKIHVSLKADGASVALYYKDGILWRAVTRGGDDGIGEDITANAMKFAGVPTQLPTPANVAVRGEVVMTVDKWREVDPDGDGNPRNIGNGIMRRLDGTQSDLLTFMAFDVEAMMYTFPTEITTEIDKARYLADAGFCVVEGVVVNGLDEAMAWYNDVAARRDQLNFWIDGVVFKMNDLALQRELGVHDNRPRGQTVLKFEADGATTTLLDVEITVGHTGALIPTGKVRPVKIGGTTVSSVLLNNFQMIKDLDVAIGDVVRIIKAKDIIPYLSEVLERPPGRRLIIEPQTCPACGDVAGRRLRRGAGKTAVPGAVTECKNPSCDARNLARLYTWVTKLDMKGLGDEVIAALVDKFNVSVPSDLYIIADDPELPNLRVGAGKLGQKRAQAISNEINRTRTLTVPEFMGSLAIQHLGRRRVRLIMDAVPGVLDTVDDWLDTAKIMSVADAAGIPNIAGDIADGIAYATPQIRELLKYVTVNGENNEMVANQTGSQTGVFAGMSVCFTGKINKVDNNGKRYTREMMQRLVVDHGGAVSDDVRAGTTHLVQADKDSISSKSTKAKKMGIAIMSEEEFFAMIGQ